MEVSCNESLPGADPLQQDMYVEVDSTTEQTLTPDVIAAVSDAFAEAPVSNPDGSEGINIHVIIDDTSLEANGTVYSENRTGNRNDMYDYRDSHFDHRGTGYYYLLLTDDVAYDGDSYYVGAGRPGIAAMELFDSTRITSSLFMHEFGHSLGLHAHYDGIDDDRYSVEEYDSVMNYNGLYEQLTYSTGTDSVGRDEWDFIATDRHQPTVHCAANETCSTSCTAA